MSNFIVIAHRGNIKGPNKRLENSPDYLLRAAEIGYHVEVDVWYIEKQFFLGHDEPEYQVPDEFLLNPKFWCHAKNISALSSLQRIGARCFWHQEDDVTLTSDGYLWTYPGKELKTNSIALMPELWLKDTDPPLRCAGVCTDYASDWLLN